MTDIIETIRHCAAILVADGRSTLLASAVSRSQWGQELHAIADGLESGAVIGTPEVYIVRPLDPSEDVAGFIDLEDAERFRATYDDPSPDDWGSTGAGDVESVILCDSALAAQMVEQRNDDLDDEDGEN